MLLALLLQSSGEAPPDIEFNARIEARSVTIEKRGNASLALSAEPERDKKLVIEAPKAEGRKRLRNVVIDLRGEARIAAPRRSTR